MGTIDLVKPEVRFDPEMGNVDALMWLIEDDPVLRSTIVAVGLLEREPDHDRLTERVARSTELIPRLRHIAVPGPLGRPPQWVDAPWFDLGYHLRWLGAPGDGSMSALLDLAAHICVQPFDRARPLWQHTIVEGLADGRAAMIIKAHHALTDGVGGMEIVAGLLLDVEAAPDLPPPEPTPTEQERQAPQEPKPEAEEAKPPSPLRLEAQAPLGVGDIPRSVGSALRVVAPVPGPMSPVMTGRSVNRRFHVLNLSLADLKRASRATGGSINDVFLTGLGGGLRRYHLRYGRLVDHLRVAMPINLRRKGDEVVVGNRYIPARFPLPVGVEDPRERLRLTAAQVANERVEPALQFTEGFAFVIRQLPPRLRQRLFGRMLKGVDVVASNVPGVPVHLSIGGARLESLTAFGPTCGAALNVTMLTYLDQASVGVSSDPAAIPDHDTLLACLDEGFREVALL